MTLNPSQTHVALGQLSKPGEAAVRFNTLISQSGWAVLGVGLNDLPILAEHFGEAWQQEVLGLVAALMAAGRAEFGTSDDLLSRLTSDTFLIITAESHAPKYAEALRQRFRISISAKIPAEKLCGQMICLSESERLPLPSLVVGLVPIRKLAGRVPTPGTAAAWEPPLLGFSDRLLVTANDGPFATARNLLNKVTEARNQNERLSLKQELGNLTFTVGRLWEERVIMELAPQLHSVIKRFADVTTGPIHDLRNGLIILQDEAGKLAHNLPNEKSSTDVLNSVRYCRFLLETCSEIRFRGGSNFFRTEMVSLLKKNLSLLGFRFQTKIHYLILN